MTVTLTLLHSTTPTVV